MQDRPSTNHKPLVLLVHGTFAAEDANAGERWWQEDSEAWKQLKKTLSEEVELASGAEVFHWSGRNAERARHEAGMQLLDRLTHLERQKRPYHLIGHSHGGSVIWLALQAAIKRRWRSSPALDEELQLNHLKSWTTVGTPFLQFQGSHLGKWYGRVFTFLTLVVVACALAILVMHLNQRFKITSHWRQFATIPDAPAEAIAEAAPDAPEIPNEGAQKLKAKFQRGQVEQLGAKAEQFRSALGNEVLRVSLITKPNSGWDWFTLGFICVAAPLLASAFYVWLSALRVEARSVLRGERIRNQAMLDFGKRWLGVWCSEDEAINGLRGSLKLSGEVIPRLEVPSESVFDSDRVVRFHRGLVRWLIAPFYNRFVAPQGDHFLWNRVSKGAQGHDRPGCKLKDVSEGPIALENFRYPPIPEELDRALIAAADKKLNLRAGEILTNARSALAQFAWGSANLPSVISSRSGKFVHGGELIHNSYFQSPGVLEMLAANIRMKNPRRPAAPTPPPLPGRLAPPQPENPPQTAAPAVTDSPTHWIATFQNAIETHVLENPLVRKLALPKLGKPNRIAWAALAVWLNTLCIGPCVGVVLAGIIWAIVSGITGSDSDVLMGVLMVAGMLLFPIVSVAMAGRALHLASLGARRERVSRWVIESTTFLTAIAGLSFGGWYLYDSFFAKTDRKPSLRVEFRPDEQALLSSSGHHVKIRKIETGETTLLRAPNVRGLAVTPDQTLLVCATDKGLKIWDLPRRKLIVDREAYGIQSVTFSTNGQLVATGQRNGTVKLWYAANGAEVATLRGHRDWVRALAFTRDDRLLATGSDDGTIRVWDVARNHGNRLSHKHRGNVRAVAFSPDGSMLLSGADGEAAIWIWDVETGQRIGKQEAHSGGVHALTFLNSGRAVASGGADKRVKVWKLADGALHADKELEGHPAAISSIGFHPQGNQLASRCQGDILNVWDLASASLIRSFVDVEAEIHALDFSGNGQTLAVGGHHSIIRLYGVRSGMTGNLDTGFGQVKSLAVSPDGQFLAASKGDVVAGLWNVRTGQKVSGLEEFPGTTKAVAFSPDGSLLAYGRGYQVGVRNGRTGEYAGQFEGHSNTVTSVAFSPDSTKLASGAWDSTVRIWDVSSGEPLAHYEAQNWVSCVAFSPDGNFVASGDWSDTVDVWEVDGYQETPRHRLTGHTDDLTAVSFNSDGRYLASAAEDETIRIWDLQSGELLHTLQHAELISKQGSFAITCLRFSPTDPTLLASGSADFTAKLWNVETGELVKTFGTHR